MSRPPEWRLVWSPHGPSWCSSWPETARALLVRAPDSGEPEPRLYKIQHGDCATDGGAGVKHFRATAAHTCNFLIPNVIFPIRHDGGRRSARRVSKQTTTPRRKSARLWAGE